MLAELAWPLETLKDDGIGLIEVVTFWLTVAGLGEAVRVIAGESLNDKIIKENAISKINILRFISSSLKGHCCCQHKKQGKLIPV